MKRLGDGGLPYAYSFFVDEADDGSYRASALGIFIHPEAYSLEKLQRLIRDAVHCP